jgi:hypothetical protein
MSTSTSSASTSSDSSRSTSVSESSVRRGLYRYEIERTGRERHELSVCADSPPHWLNHWGYTFDPREDRSKQLPFDLFPRQAELLAWLAEREAKQEEGIIEKSRDTGVTWLCAAFALHRWLFRPGYSVGFGSRKKELVDRLGDPDCIFEKIRFLLYSLPTWMLPAGFRRADHDNLAKLLNPDTGASITGEGGKQIGRGGRKSLYFIDESAYLDYPKMVDSALSATTRVRIDVSTPNGPGNPFAQKRHSGNFPVFTFHWTSDPRKDQAYYESFKKQKGETVTAEQLDIDYTASIDGICIPAKWVRAAVNFPLEPSGPVVGGLDVAEFGSDRCVYLARKGPKVGRIEDWGQCNTTETAWRAAELARRDGCQTAAYDANAVGAGVTGPWQSAEGSLGFVARAIMSQSTEGMDQTYWPDGKTSAEKFINLRAELWHKLRDRFEKTYERVTGNAFWPDEECISIPDHPQLIAELSQPLRQHTQTGKLKVESKEDMRKRGVKSPNFADALALSEAALGQEWTGIAADPKSSFVSKMPKDVWLPDKPDQEDWGGYEMWSPGPGCPPERVFDPSDPEEGGLWGGGGGRYEPPGGC